MKRSENLDSSAKHGQAMEAPRLCWRCRYITFSCGCEVKLSIPYYCMSTCIFAMLEINFSVTVFKIVAKLTYLVAVTGGHTCI